MFKLSKPLHRQAEQGIAQLDFTSSALKDPTSYNLEYLNSLGIISGDVSCSCYSPVQSLLAVGTNNGAIHLFGKATFSFEASRTKIRFIAWRDHQLYCVTADNNIIVWDTSVAQGGGRVSTGGKCSLKRDSISSLRSTVTYVHPCNLHNKRSTQSVTVSLL